MAANSYEVVVVEDRDLCIHRVWGLGFRVTYCGLAGSKKIPHVLVVIEGLCSLIPY